MGSKYARHWTLLGILLLGAFLLLSAACQNRAAPTPASIPTPAPVPAPTQPAAPPPTPERPTSPPVDLWELRVVMGPLDCATYSLDPQPAMGSRYEPGTPVTIYVSPAPGCQVKEWLGAESTTPNMGQVNMDADRVVRVNLQRATPTAVPVPLPTIAYSPASLSFTATQGGPSPPSRTLKVWNSEVGNLRWSASDDAAWLSLNPISGSSTGESDTDTLTVSVNISGMSAGSYSAAITIAAPGATNTPRPVPVSLTLLSESPTIGYSPASLSFTAAQGGSNPSSRTLQVWNSGGGDLRWSANDDAVWLSLSPMSGTSTGKSDTDTLTVSVNISGMSAGSYSATITISAPGATNTPRRVLLTLTLFPESPTITYSPASLSFTATQGGPSPSSRTLQVWNSGGGDLRWSVNDDAAWLSLNPMSGTSTGQSDTDAVTVSVNISGMSAGSYSATITISAPGATNTPRTVPVTLTVLQGG